MYRVFLYWESAHKHYFLIIEDGGGWRYHVLERRAHRANSSGLRRDNHIDFRGSNRLYQQITEIVFRRIGFLVHPGQLPRK